MAKKSPPAAVYVDPDELNPWPQNPRIHDVDAIARSIERFGFGAPIVARKDDGRVIAGHGRLAAARQLGLESVPVRYMDLADEEANALALADNQLIGDWDDDALAQVLAQLEIDEIDIEGLGFSDKELNQLLNQTTGPIEEDDVPAPPETPRTKTGDLWILGKHRLLCGDCTKPEDVEKVMDGKKADMLLTDPPYGISVVGKNGKIGGSVLAKNKKYIEVKGDDSEMDLRFMFKFGETQYIFGANYFVKQLPKNGQWIVWDKQRPEGTTFSDCELIWTNRDGANVEKLTVVWHGMIREGESEKRKHPTQKPIKLISILIEKTTGLIFDPFLGSGTTLIAAEKLNRICYGMEIEPIYCDVIVQRWENSTGKKAVRKNATLSER